MATGIEPTLVNAGIKAITPVAEVLLKSKFDKLKKWLKEHDLNKQLQDDELNKFFFPYFKRLHKKVSTIQTIVFPQQELDIEEIFEPLFLTDREHWGEKKSIQMLDILDGSSYIIIDDAGMGKSTFAKSLTLAVIREMDLVPIFIELRTLDEKSLLDALKNELNSVYTIIDNEVFLKLLEMKKFLIVLDGFDEISIDEQPRISQEITDLCIKSEVTLILTSRPENPLPRIPHSKALKFVPLEMEQTKSLIHRYDQIANLDIGMKLIDELINVPSRFLETPLLVALLYRTFGFNNSIASKTSTFYDEIYNAMYKGHDLTKAGFSREKKSALDYEDFRKLLRAFAFVLLTSKNESIKSISEATEFIQKAIKLSKIVLSSPSNFLDDLLSSVPLMYKDGQYYRFMHKTIIEFFAAEFLAYSDNALGLLQQVYTTKTAKNFEKSFDYLEELKPYLFKKIIVQDIASKFIYFSKSHPLLDNDILITFLFMYDSFLLLEEYKEDDDHKNDDENICSRAYFYGTLNGLKCRLTIASSYAKFLNPYAVQKYIFTNIEPEYNLEHHNINFDGIESFISLNERMDIDYNLFVKILLYPLTNKIFRSICTFFASDYISVEKSTKLLQELQEEESEEQLISSFLE